MQLVRRFRLSAVFCALAVLACELVSRPYANMGVADDWPYILSARALAATGRIVYKGWAAPILGWQLYLGAGFIKLFGFSLTTVRMSTLLVAMVMAFVLQRTLVRANINERNATIGTLALVLSPLYLMLSVTFMSDIGGLFAVVLCLYGCLRALQSSTSRSTIAWLCFAVLTNAICGTSRQIAWLGILVMVPSTVWLLRRQRSVVLAGAALTLVGALFIFGCMHWFAQQPYSVPEHLDIDTSNLGSAFWQFIHFFLDIPFVLLPVVAIFLLDIRKSRPRIIAMITFLFAVYLGVAIQPTHRHGLFLLDPAVDDWISVFGTYRFTNLKGTSPLFLHTGFRVLLTIASLGGLIGLVASLLRSCKIPAVADLPHTVSWKQLGVLLGPFTLANVLILVPSSTTAQLFDRYLLILLVVALVCIVRYYEERIQPQLPPASIFLVAMMAILGIAMTHNMFALYRARVAIAAELRSAGIPDTSVDNGWEYNFGVELAHSDHINYPTILVPAGAYTPTFTPPNDICKMWGADFVPHIHPLYAASFDPEACYGRAPFAPVAYSRWLSTEPGALYVVDFTAASAR